jgi:long-chain acyl-CoA synthetase
MRIRNAMALVGRCESLGQMLEETARRYPRRRALILKRGAWSYRDLNAIANRYAHALREKLGLVPSDRVAILLANDIHYIFACLGAFKAGAVVVPLNCFLTAPELKFILADSAATVLVTSDQFAPVVRKFSDEIPTLRALVTVGREDLGNDTWLCEEFIKGVSDSNPRWDVKRNHLSVIIYTSGTTGKPKGAMLTHGNLLSNIISSGMSIRISRRDRLLLILPMFHSFTLTTCILMPIAVGAGIIPVSRLRSIPHIIRSMMLMRATILIGIPHIYDVIAQRGIPWWLRIFMSLRVCISGSAPLSEATLKNFEARVKIPLLEGYGLSETSPVVSINPLEGIRKPGSVGKPIPGVAVKIVSGEGGELPPGRVGEIAVRGPNVMCGYLNHPRETKETIRDGWLLTGDIGKIDGDGYIYILDRKKDMILFHGMNVYPREIEEVLYTHHSVAEAAVVGKPDPRRGEVPVAFVSLKDGARIEAAALIQFCRQSLAGYKIPHRIIVLEKLPRTATGKILKRELKNIITKNYHELTLDLKGGI